MGRWFNVLAMLGLLSACGPVSFYYKPGVSVARQQTDLTNCEVAALRDAPVATQIRQGAPTYYPGERYCDSRGRCFYRPGYWIEGPIYTVDANSNLRDRVLAQCMAGRGYAPVSLPRCASGVAQSTPRQAMTTLPPLGQTSCIITHRDGSWQIVTPG
jgi:hypothetical protein